MLDPMVVLVFQVEHRSITGKHARGRATPVN
jgi:hypothetical protein